MRRIVSGVLVVLIMVIFVQSVFSNQDRETFIMFNHTAFTLNEGSSVFPLGLALERGIGNKMEIGLGYSLRSLRLLFSEDKYFIIYYSGSLGYLRKTIYEQQDKDIASVSLSQNETLRMVVENEGTPSGGSLITSYYYSELKLNFYYSRVLSPSFCMHSGISNFNSLFVAFENRLSGKVKILFEYDTKSLEENSSSAICIRYSLGTKSRFDFGVTNIEFDNFVGAPKNSYLFPYFNMFWKF